MYRFGQTRCHKHEHIPDIQLQGSKLAFVNTYVYLGHLITCDLTDDADILRQRRLLCIRANMLARCFSVCSSEIKDHLFKGASTPSNIASNIAGTSFHFNLAVHGGDIASILVQVFARL